MTRMTTAERIKAFFAKLGRAPKAETKEPEKPNIDAAGRASFEYGLTTGNYYNGDAVYHPLTEIDPVIYEKYKAKELTMRTIGWTVWEIAKEYGITVQNAADMVEMARCEYNNRYLSTLRGTK